MKKLIIALIILFIISCSKTEVPVTPPPTPVVQEESIKFATNLDTGTYNVIDTLPIVITVSSKLPSAGVLYSITTTWTDSSKQIFKIDTSLTVSTLSMNIPGLKKAGNYSVAVTVTSKSTVSNTLNKSISIINNPLARFMGYKVASNAKQLGTEYWANTPVLSDYMDYKFQTPVSGQDHISNAGNIINGDFNNDGWIDIFAPGMAYAGNVGVNTSFLIWNPSLKKFEDKNLFNDKTINLAKTNPPRVIPVYLNNDDYVDIVVFGYVDEGIPGDLPNPIILVLSDGKGGYDITKIITETPLFYHGGGDIGDLNGDKIPDLVINYGGMMRILWGKNTYPYFDQNYGATFALPIVNLYGGVQVVYKNDNGFGETCIECVSSYIGNSKIYDVNKDGLNDLVLCGSDNGQSPSRVLINKGAGKFNISSIITLPFATVNTEPKHDLDFIVDDINGDGLNDIISLHVNWNYSIWELTPMIQKSDGSFKIDYSFVVNNHIVNTTTNSTIGKEKLIYVDVNGDGKKDIFFYEINNMNQLKDKTVFIRTGNQFIEQDIFQFDLFAKSLIK
jgi:hypothetical protein